MAEIEFRWKQSDQPEPDGPADFPPGYVMANPMPMKLQFRLRKGPEGDGWWGEWQDIDIVGSWAP